MITKVSYEEAGEILDRPVMQTRYDLLLHWTDSQDTSLIIDCFKLRTSILEIGTHFGYTAANMGKNLRAHICTLDIVKDMIFTLPGFQEHELLSREESGKMCKGIENVTQLKCHSDDFFKNTEGMGAIWDGILVDGSHEYSQVLKDSNNALDRVKKGGVVVWHDVYNKYLDIESPKVAAEPDNDGVVKALENLSKEVFKIEDSWIAFTIK